MSHSREEFEQFAEKYVRREQELRDPFLRAIQRRFDVARFDRTYPAEAGGVDSRDAKVFHIGKHVGKALGKMNALFVAGGPVEVPKAEAVVMNEVLPDVLIYRTQLANTLRFNMTHLSDDGSRWGFDDVYRQLGRARALIDELDERTDHGRSLSRLRQRIRQLAIPILHTAGMNLAQEYGIPPAAAHLDRLIFHEQQPDML